MKFNLFDYTITIKKKRKKYIKKALNAPVAPNGYVHRWIRAESISFNNRKNITGKLREGYELVKANKYRNSFPVIEKGKFKGCIGVGGLVLARVPQDIVDQRRRYYER